MTNPMIVSAISPIHSLSDSGPTELNLCLATSVCSGRPVRRRALWSLVNRVLLVRCWVAARHSRDRSSAMVRSSAIWVMTGIVGWEMDSVCIKGLWGLF